jgi:hypothetical protein
MTQPERYEMISNEQCIERYSSSIVTGSGNVVAITAEETPLNDTVFQYSGMYGTGSRTVLTFFEPFQGIPGIIALTVEGSLGNFWVCADYVKEVDFITGQYAESSCDINSLRRSPDDWTITGRRIAYCLSERATERCRLQFSVVIFWVVVLCNALKAGSMFWVFFRLRDEPLVTLGDAVASFLNSPDPYTKGQSQLAKSDVVGKLWRPGNPDPRPWYPRKLFWFRSASRTRWFTCLSL